MKNLIIGIVAAIISIVAFVISYFEGTLPYGWWLPLILTLVIGACTSFICAGIREIELDKKSAGKK